MNTDVKDLIARIKIKDPASLAVVAALVVVMVLFIVVATGLVRGIAQQRSLSEDLRITNDAIAQLRDLQAANPATMQQRLDEARAQLEGLLVGLPTQEQSAAELARYYEYATRYNAQLVRMDSDPAQASSEGDLVRAETYQLQMRGRLPDLLRLVIFLAQGPYRSFVVNSVAVVPDGPAVASVKLMVYYSTLAPAPTATPAPDGAAGGAPSPTPAGVPTLYSQ